MTVSHEQSSAALPTKYEVASTEMANGDHELRTNCPFLLENTGSGSDQNSDCASKESGEGGAGASAPNPDSDPSTVRRKGRNCDPKSGQGAGCAVGSNSGREGRSKLGTHTEWK